MPTPMRTRVLLVAAALMTLAASDARADAPAKRFRATQDGEALLALTASAPGTDWSRPGRESAVVTVELDDRYSQDVVLFAGRESFEYRLSLGTVDAGRHEVEVRLNRRKSPVGARRAKVKDLEVRVIGTDDPEALVHEHSPILYGRDLPEIPGRYENNRTDVPLLTYHTIQETGAGETIIEYSVIWSNEDGGTNTPALMARWGRSTDIEWIYRIVLGRDGETRSEVYQGPDHATLPFTGAKQDGHPLLQTATSNNVLNQVVDPSLSSGYRFFQDPSQTQPADRAREVLMDDNPWTYQVMAKELVREGKIEQPGSPLTPEVSDQRNYLWMEIAKTTSYPTPPADGTSVATAVAVRLRGDDTWYTSNKGVPDWGIVRDVPAATTVELPEGATAGDVEAIKAFAAPVARGGQNPAPAPSDYRIELRSINRGFFLDEAYLPRGSFVNWRGDITLTPQQPEAIVWPSPASR
jgi:hypothetical protein